MVDELWGMFPRLVERNIEGLLDEAEPNALRKLQIYRTVKNNGLTQASVEDFLEHLQEFFSRPRAERRKSQFDSFLDRPMDHQTFALFSIDFRTGVVPDEALYNLASWAHNLIRVSKQVSGAFMSQEVLLKTFMRITSPGRHEKAGGITFKDFTAVWKKTVTSLFGRYVDEEFESILKELEWLDGEIRKAETPEIATGLDERYYLSKVELAWVSAVRAAAAESRAMPPYQAAPGPERESLQELARVVSLYSISLTSQRVEIVRNRERIRATVLDRCDRLLGYEQKLAS